MSRLEEIKNNAKGLIDNEGHFVDLVQLDIDDYAYLYEQAEKVERYEKALNDIEENGTIYSQATARIALGHPK
jgi:hypothetical protein